MISEQYTVQSEYFHMNFCRVHRSIWNAYSEPLTVESEHLICIIAELLVKAELLPLPAK